ncbi:hypothetical protein DTO282E5_6171 [Paecilomyces variotii]|nr:hypothetical protein DTO282E5_6171 [Paecilomyces variotii]
MESYERWENPGNVGLDLQIFRQIESNTSLTQVADAATSSAYLSLWVELEGVGETRQEGGLHWQGKVCSIFDIAIRIRPLG